MPAQKREAKRNYIDLVSDEDEPYRRLPSPPVPPRPLKGYLRELLAGLLKPRGGAR
jgi:hypothetical protein